MPEFYTVKEVSIILKVHPGTVRNLIERGRLPGAYKIDPSVRSVWRIPAAAVETYQKEQQNFNVVVD